MIEKLKNHMNISVFSDHRLTISILLATKTRRMLNKENETVEVFLFVIRMINLFHFNINSIVIFLLILSELERWSASCFVSI